MKNISELFLPYELALIAKEKMFLDECLAYWVEGQLKICKDGLTPVRQTSFIGFSNSTIYCTAPLYQQIIDLFIKKNIHIFPMYFHNTKKYLYMVYDENKFSQTSHETINEAIENAFKLI